MKKLISSLLLLLALTCGLAGATTADAATWHHGSFPKTVRGYWHQTIKKNKTTVQYRYTKKYQDAQLLGKVKGKWEHAMLNRVNTYNGPVRYKVTGHHKYYFAATKKQVKNRFFTGADRMILTKKGHRLIMKLHYKGAHKWTKPTTLHAGKVK
ncbi:hypothetical protein D1831_07320 [Lactiplantibacillus garii]|uniref:Extracellular protein n=1 Tax=Lactiplantibacillus garii TaxID=2306423 RepID=A0A426D7A0_9LACO|nr:hypothetical protein [Lactiplantibacillus garii]RRK10466.1 hypothetical protein D1831_07320 [Lactiplantibacillus garii]